MDLGKDKSEIQLGVDAFDHLLTVMSESTSDKKSTGFAWNYYRPYFIEMKRRNLVEPFCYLIHRSGNDAAVTEWLFKNRGRVDEFLAWSKGYNWQAGK
jgi:hypothetical protein